MGRDFFTFSNCSGVLMSIVRVDLIELTISNIYSRNILFHSTRLSSRSLRTIITKQVVTLFHSKGFNTRTTVPKSPVPNCLFRNYQYLKSIEYSIRFHPKKLNMIYRYILHSGYILIV